MDYRNMIPGMKVRERGYETYIVRLCTRDDEEGDHDFDCVTHENLEETEGSYSHSSDLTLIKLPTSFNKANQVKNYKHEDDYWGNDDDDNNDENENDDWEE